MLDQALEHLGLYRFRQEVVKPRLKTSLTKLVIVPSCHADEHGIYTACLADPGQGTFAIQVGHAKVHEHDFGAEQFRQACASDPSEGSCGLAPQKLEQIAYRVRYIDVIVNDQSPYGHRMSAGV